MVICATADSLECALEYSFLMQYKMLVLSLIFIYSIYVVYKYKGTNWLDVKQQKSNFDFLKQFMSYIMSSFYIYLSPFILILLKPEITFEMFLKYLTVGYIIFIVLTLGLSILFLDKFVRWFFTKQTVSSVRERLKYAKKN